MMISTVYQPARPREACRHASKVKVVGRHPWGLVRAGTVRNGEAKSRGGELGEACRR